MDRYHQLPKMTQNDVVINHDFCCCRRRDVRDRALFAATAGRTRSRVTGRDRAQPPLTTMREIFFFFIF